MRHNEEYLGVDVGAARVGIARGSTLAKIAAPLKTVPAGSAVEELIKIAAELKPVGIVVGLPRNLEGQETPQTDAVRDWVANASSKISLPFYWQDEALTSHLAESQNPELAAGPDAAAAAIILQDFLDTPSEERVRC